MRSSCTGSLVHARRGRRWPRLRSLAAGAVLALFAATTTKADVQLQCGDVTTDGEITAADALGALRAALELAACEPCVCDADGSGDVSAADALVLLRLALGQEVELECPSCTTTTVFQTTTTTEPPKVACGDSRAGAPACDGYCGVNGQMCVEAPPGSGNCQCIFGPSCGAAGGPPVCAGGCHALWICTDIGGTCRCVF